ncbi:hypothetical protein RMCBS344292_09934 [Rhizopus microsporus]|nr:hypothetical protein RMCBS344292_09934 [Rhizopus microsporus]
MNHYQDWREIKVSTLVKDQKVIEISSKISIEEACQVLFENNISSAPIKHEGNYIGVFDYGDVIAYILLVLQPRDKEKEGYSIQDIMNKALKGEKVSVGLVSDSTLSTAIEIFALGTRRVCVVKPDGGIQGILSQSTVIQYLYEHTKQFPELGECMNKTIHQLNLGKEPVISVPANATVLNALMIMSQHGVSSLAVVSSDKIIGNISMTDVKHVMKSYRHGLLWKTCFQFVSYIKLEQGIIEGQDRLPVFDVRPDTHLGFAIAKLLATKAHRVWVTDEKQQLLGVVSLTDVFRILATVAGIKLPNENRRTSLNVSTFNRRDIK